jgi:hypothetical protein
LIKAASALNSFANHCFLEIHIVSRLFFVAILVLLSGNAMAVPVPVVSGWEYIGDNDGETHYIIKSSIKKSGKTVKMWSLIDFKTPQELTDGKYLSLKKQVDYDCNNSRFRMLSAVATTGNMGKGDIVLNVSIKEDEKNSGNGFKWKEVIPDSAMEELFKYACGLKH